MLVECWQERILWIRDKREITENKLKKTAAAAVYACIACLTYLALLSPVAPPYTDGLIGGPSIGLSNTSINVSIHCIVAVGRAYTYFLALSDSNYEIKYLAEQHGLFSLPWSKRNISYLNIYSLIIKLFTTTLWYHTFMFRENVSFYPRNSWVSILLDRTPVTRDSLSGLLQSCFVC